MESKNKTPSICQFKKDNLLSILHLQVLKISITFCRVFPAPPEPANWRDDWGIIVASDDKVEKGKQAVVAPQATVLGHGGGARACADYAAPRQCAAVVGAIGGPGSPPPTTSSYHAASPRPTGRRNTVGDKEILESFLFCMYLSTKLDEYS